MAQNLDADSANREVAKVDLSKYRTGPLVEQLTNLVSVPSAFRRILRTMVLIDVVAILACVLLMPMEEFHFAIKAGMYVYCITIGLVVGIVFGIIRVIAIAMTSVEEILNITLRITGQAATDYEQLQAGTARMPTGGELTEQVYEEVILPTIEKVAGGAFGFFGKPVMWVYRRTLGAAVSFLIKAVKKKSEVDAENGIESEEDVQLQESVKSGIAGVAKYSKRINAFTSKAATVVSTIGGKIRFYAMFPIYSVFTAMLLIALVPPLLVSLFAS